jgi:hypothetical protein
MADKGLKIIDGNKTLKGGMKLIMLMKADIMQAMDTEQPLVIEGEALGALLTVVEVAEHATAKQIAPILGTDGKIVS